MLFRFSEKIIYITYVTIQYVINYESVVKLVNKTLWIFNCKCHGGTGINL